MGKRNFLIEGVSGAGKTTVASYLEKKGYHVVHGDRELVYRGDPATGEPLTPDINPPTPQWDSDHQLWDLEKVTFHISNKDEEFTFFCGSSRNYPKFIDLLDGVFILDVDRETMMRRIEQRVAADPTDFGATQEERDLILRLHETKQDVPKVGHVINASQPLEKVVGEILCIIRQK